MIIEQKDIEIVKNMYRSLDALGYLGEFITLMTIINILAGIISTVTITISAVLLLLFNFWLLTKARLIVNYANETMKYLDIALVLHEKLLNLNIQKIIIKEGQNDTTQDNSHQG